jgi:hypothetical protein
MSSVYFPGMFVATRVAPPTPSGGYPAWRRNKTKDTLYQISGTANMSGLSINYLAPFNVVQTWNGLAGGNKTGINKQWTVANGGHGEAGNGVFVINYAVDAPAWSTVKAASNAADYTLDAYYRDNTPTSTHTYYGNQHIRAGKLPDGKERVCRFLDSAAYGLDGSGPAYDYGSRLNTYNLTDGRWDVSGTYPNVDTTWARVPLVDAYGANALRPTTCQDPRTDDVYLSFAQAMVIFRVATATYEIWTSWPASQGGLPAYPNFNQLQSWNSASSGQASCIDTTRNKIVCLLGREQIGVTALQRVPLTADANGLRNTDYLALNASWSLAGEVNGAGMIYDSDNDRYIVAADSAMYAIHPTSGVVTVLATGISGDTLHGYQGHLNRLAFFPDLHCVVLVAQYAADIYFLPTA